MSQKGKAKSCRQKLLERIFHGGSGENITSDRVWSLDISQCPITLLSLMHFQLNLYSNSNYTLTSAANGGDGLKFWVRLKGLYGKGIS